MGTAQTWNGTYENQPTDGSSPANGDDEIRNLKTTLRGKFNKEHWFGTDAGIDDTNTLAVQGTHRAGSAMPFIQATAPSERPDGSTFDFEYDYGRLWLDMGNGAKMMYLYFEDEDDVTPEWKPVINYSVGEIAAFAFTPADADRWVPCDGRQITAAEESVDGVTGGYEALVTALRAEANSDTDHPYLRDGAADTAYLPDLRGVSLRGIDDMTAAGSILGAAGRDTAGRVNTELLEVDVLETVVGSYQTDSILDHDHRMDHTHGKLMLLGHDTGDGRTGAITSWSGGEPTFEDETGNWDGDSYLTTDGVLTMRDPGRDQGERDNNDTANDINRTVDLQHHHVIGRHTGLTEMISATNAVADSQYALPERDYSYADENVSKNVSVYYFIRY